jgi:hypothetical protein
MIKKAKITNKPDFDAIYKGYKELYDLIEKALKPKKTKI